MSLTNKEIIQLRNKYNIGSAPAVDVDVQKEQKATDRITRLKGLQREPSVFEQAGVDTATEEPGETGRTGLAGVGTGVLKGIGSTLKGASSLGERFVRGTLRTFLPKSLEKGLGLEKQGEDLTGAEELISEETFKPEGTAEKIGFYGEQIGEFFIPGSMSLKAGKVASSTVKGGKVVKGAAKLAGIGATEAVLGTGQSAMQSGELGKEELKVGAMSLVAPAVLAGLGKGIKAVIPKSTKVVLREAIDKALRPSAKSLSNPKYYDKAEQAFTVMNKYSKTLDGVIEKPQTISETIDLLGRAKRKIYDIYSSISKSAGEAGAKFNPRKIQADLSNWVKETGYSHKVKAYASKRLQELSTLDNANPSQIQQRIEELNTGLTLFPSTGFDKVSNQIDASIAQRLRQNLDELIENTGGENYQYFRNEYSALKTVEKDLERSAGIQARKAKAGLADLTDIFTGGEITAGLLSANPTLVAKGVAGKSIKEYIKWLNNPNRYIKNAFSKLGDPVEDVVAKNATMKLLGAAKEGAPRTQVISDEAIALGARSASTVEAQEIARIQAVLERNKWDYSKLPKNDLLLLVESQGKGQGIPIPLPARTQSTIDKAEIARLSTK